MLYTTTTSMVLAMMASLTSSASLPHVHVLPNVALRRAALRAQRSSPEFIAGYEQGFDEGAAAAISAPTGGPQTTLYYPGYNNRTCFRVPAMVTVKDTIFAFAEARTGMACFNDDCNPLNPIRGDGRTAVVFRTSTDVGKTWSAMTDICKQGKGATGCGDYEVVYDEVRARLVVQYAQYDATREDTPPFDDHSHWAPHAVMETRSTDMGKTWSAPLSRDHELQNVTENCHPYCDLIVGPGRGLQLLSDAHGKQGRLLFCGHKTDAVYNRVSPIWTSDDGDNYTLRAVLKNDDTANGMGKWGPDECQLAELANGSVYYNGRNNWVSDSWNRSQPLPWQRLQNRITSRSDDGGDTWSAVRYDPTLSDHSHGCEASLLTFPAKSNTLFFGQPLTPGRQVMTVHRSDDGGTTWPHYMVVARGAASYSSMSTLPPVKSSRTSNHASTSTSTSTNTSNATALGLLYERDGAWCTPLSVACQIVFTTFPTNLP